MPMPLLSSFRCSMAAIPAPIAVALALLLCPGSHAQQSTLPPDPVLLSPATPQAAAAPTEAPQATPPAASTPAQQPAQATPAEATAPAAAAAPAQAHPAEAESTSQAGAITEDELKQMLVGKALYLRGGYLDNSISFDEHGHISGHSPQGSYTLSAIQIDKVRLTKHKVELEGLRFGLHFVGQLAYEDSSKALERVRITPKKKTVKITIDREIVVTPKKKKEPKAPAAEKGKKGKTPVVAAPKVAPVATASGTPPPDQPAAAAEPAEMTPEEQLKASIAATPEAERPADEKSVTTTTSPAHATKVLKEALDEIFAPGLDDRMMASMPDFWKLYYKAVADHADYRPKDPAVLRQNAVDQKARLITKFEPDSNEFAQAAGVAGMALYHAVIMPDGHAGEVAVARPIGFGLDESAVASIRKATFQPAIKDGKPVPVMLDLVVQFRIFSKRTAVHANPDSPEKAAERQLPGPYTVMNMPKPTQPPATQTPPPQTPPSQ